MIKKKLCVSCGPREIFDREQRKVLELATKKKEIPEVLVDQ